MAVTGRDPFDPDCSTVAELKAHDHRGGLGDTIVKQRLETVPLDRLAPIRAHHATWADRTEDVRGILRDGIRRAEGRTQATLDAVTDRRDLFRPAS